MKKANIRKILGNIKLFSGPIFPPMFGTILGLETPGTQPSQIRHRFWVPEIWAWPRVGRGH